MSSAIAIVVAGEFHAIEGCGRSSAIESEDANSIRADEGVVDSVCSEVHRWLPRDEGCVCCRSHAQKGQDGGEVGVFHGVLVLSGYGFALPRWDSLSPSNTPNISSVTDIFPKTWNLPCKC